MYGKYVGYKTVLELVNRGREALGLDPLATLPRGTRKSHDSCPIANAIDGGCRVSLTKLYLYEGNAIGRFTDPDLAAKELAAAWNTDYDGAEQTDGTHATVELPAAIRRFIERFDEGRLFQAA